jgi:DNA-binding transcriptional LysR family regulator
LLGYAKRILELNDDAPEVIRGSEMEGWVRLGLPQDLAESWLPAVLKRFSRLIQRFVLKFKSIGARN